MLRPLQRANRPCNRRIEIRPRPRNHPRRKRRRIELVLRIQNQRSLHRRRPLRAWLFPVQQMQKVRRNRILESLHLNPPPVARVVVPIQQHRPERRQQRIRNSARPGVIVVQSFGQHAAKHRHAGPQHVHRMRGGRQQFQRLLYRRGQTAQRPQARLVRSQLRRIRQLAMNEQVRHFLILAVPRQVLDVVAAIVQIVAAVAHRAQRRIARRRARQRNRLFGFENHRRS